MPVKVLGYWDSTASEAKFLPFSSQQSSGKTNYKQIKLNMSDNKGYEQTRGREQRIMLF